MTDPFQGRLPSGELLERAIVQAKAGSLSADDFRAALTSSMLMVGVVAADDAGEREAARPFVIDLDGVDYGVAFTSPEKWDTFTAQPPFVLLDGADLGASWPAGLGIALNPGTEPSMLLAPANLTSLFHPQESGPTAVPAGTEIRVGAPDPGLPPQAQEVLREAVRADPAIDAAYQLAFAQGDGPIQLVVGVESAAPLHGTAEGFAETVVRRDPGFGQVAFVDLDGSLLEMARRASPPLR